MPAAPIIIDDNDDSDANADNDSILATWKADEWIGTGKKYPAADTPRPVLAARRKMLALLPEHRQLLPDVHLSVADLLNADLPAQSVSCAMLHARHWFHAEEPNEDLTSIKNRLLPPKDVLGNLYKEFGQAWFNNALSILDPQYQNSRLPLNVLTFWQEMSITISKKAAWVQADEWLSRGRLQQDADEARTLFHILAWGMPIRTLNVSAPVETLTQLLGNRQLDDEILNMACAVQARRASLDQKHTTSVVVAPTYLYTQIEVAFRTKAWNNPKNLLPSRYWQLIKEGKRKVLLMPALVNTNHWVLFEANFEMKRLRCGDSLKEAGSSVKKSSRVILEWLRRGFGGPFTAGDTLPHGKQSEFDGVNCSIYVINTLEHYLFDQPLIGSQTVRAARIRCFVQLAKAHSLDEVRRQELAAGSSSGSNYVPSSAEELHVLCDYNLTGPSSLSVPHLPEVAPQAVPPTSEPSYGPPLPRSPPRPASSSSSDSESESRLECKSGSDDEDPSAAKWKVWHSICNKWYRMKKKGDIGCFKKHVEEGCKGPKQPSATSSQKTDPKQSAANTQSAGRLDQFIQRPSESTHGHSKSSTPSASSRSAAPRSKLKSASVLRFTTLDNFFAPVKETSQSKTSHALSSLKTRVDNEPGYRLVPCGGITEAHDKRLRDYLRRPTAEGGGARSLPSIARECYHTDFNALTPEQRGIVRDKYVHEWKWTIDRPRSRVFSTKCAKTVKSAIVRSEYDPSPLCKHCEDVLHLHSFTNALRVPVTDDKNLKYLNEQYRQEGPGQIYASCHGIKDLIESDNPDASIFLRFAVAILQKDEFGKDEPFIDLVKAMLLKWEREERGVGMQNFDYGPALREFANMCAIMSPEVYRRLRTHFQLPDIRTLKRDQAKLPRFPFLICDRTFDIAQSYLTGLAYDGPVALSCDDTKLHPAYRTCWDPDKQVHMLVGGTDEPLAVANPEELQELLNGRSEDAKASKLRLWTLQVPMPGIPPLILAAKAIPNSLSADELTMLLLQILDGLALRNIHTVSYSCDGTETERAVQHSIVQMADSTFTYTIPHPSQGSPPLDITMARIHGRPLVMIQDAKHGRKTYRNNLFSGARALVMGNYIAMYSDVRDLAFCEDPSLYVRDAERVDRQDDNGAIRLFSAAAFASSSKHFPEWIGLLVYLFIFGELIDAYQNRHISHLEWIRMCLRALYFMEAWRRFLALSGYPEARYFISREAADITKILIHGLILLIVVYRDHLGSKPYPLLPWLHSTEVCEHVFGECRKLVKDFTFLDFIFMVPRLSILVRQIIKDGFTLDPKATAAGYAHTYYDNTNLDLGVLATFPTDEEINLVAVEAWDEASNLLDLLGIVHSDLYSTDDASQMTSLPSISSWFPTTEDSAAMDPGEITDDDEWEGDSNEADDEESEAAQLERLIAQENDAPIRNKQTDDRLFNLTCAAVSLMLDETMAVQRYNSSMEEKDQQDEDRTYLQDSFHAAALQLPSLDLPTAEPIRPFDRTLINGVFDFDYTSLISIRETHQTQRAVTAVRSGRQSTLPMTDNSDDSRGTSARQRIFREMTAMIKMYESNTLGVGTGLDRQVRTQGRSAVETAGNSANAALAAGQRAAAAVTRRLKNFSAYCVPQYQELGDALIGKPSPAKLHHTPLTAGIYGIVLHENKLFVGRVITLYCRSGGKGVTHSWQAEAASIGAVSYVVLQLYEAVLANRFRAIHRHVLGLQTFTFAHVPSDHFLRTLPGSQSLSADRRTLQLDHIASNIFQTLDTPQSKSAIRKAVEALDKARRRSKVREDHVDS
ncbi:hypothetical protein NM688_g2825 [Phlebia brevispora]|uniref:Uncharacterized protein n=1 Tax=Phlebia brevispora TaxID=194682 RepID=A0ACC1T7J0_9APHY|nr:hypothetical protein NM688_g2825 [Phlebia brevispora]